MVSLTKDELEKQLKKFVSVELKPSLAHLSNNQKEALNKLRQVSAIMDQIFWVQMAGSKYPQLLEDLKKMENKEMGELATKLFWINMGPHLSIEDGQPFVKGVEKRAPHANFYPSDMSKEEFESWVQTLPANQQEDAKGFFHVIRREGNQLKAVPYSEEYKELLQPAVKLLKDAAQLVENESLKNFLEKRADAFLSNSYVESDIAWLDISEESPIDVTVGPYEVYQDTLFGYKSTFEAFICVRDFEETKKLKKFESLLQTLEDNLPLEQKYKNPKIGATCPMVVVDTVIVGGDRGGPQTSAFSLPNDEKVIAMKGSKKVMLKNVQAAKYESILVPIHRRLIVEEQQAFVSFEAFFTHVLTHEVLHGLGPHTTNNGNSVRHDLQTLHSPLEEAKADIAGLWALQFLMDHGHVDKSLEKTVYGTFLSGCFRSIRFGLEESHAKGQVIQLNFLLEKGGFVFDEKNTKFSVNFDRVKEGVTELSRIIMTIQAEGDKTKAEKFMETYGHPSEGTKKALELIQDLPIDIAPIYN